MNRFYELTYIISSDLSKEELKNISQEISDFIIKEGGKVDEEAEPIRKRLAYSIKKKTEAFLVTLNFHLSAKGLEELEKKLLKEKKQILRYLIITKKVTKKIPRRAARRLPLRTPVTEAATEGVTHKPIATPKIELKEIDKEIEEILKE